MNQFVKQPEPHVDSIWNVPDALVDARTEEAVLATMMSGVRVESLEKHHFTSRIRSATYALLRSGVLYEGLHDALGLYGLRDDEGYLTDLFVTPLLPHKPLVEAVAELKRLHLMRRFCADVDAWRVKAPGLDWSVALRQLGEVIRRQGQEASRELGSRGPLQNDASGPTPK